MGMVVSCDRRRNQQPSLKHQSVIKAYVSRF